MKQCPGVIEATQEAVVLVLELGDKTLLRSPEMIKKVIQNEQVWKEIEKVMLAEGKRLVQIQQKGKVVTAGDAAKAGKKVAKAAADAATSDLKKQIEGSSAYHKVKQSLGHLQCSLKQSPVGVFVDENKGWLILVGVGVALGGATAMYVLRDGDPVAAQAAKLANKALRFKVLGNVEVGAKDIKFEPSTRTVETTTFASVKWQRVETKLDLHVAFKDDQLTATSARGEVVVKVAEGLKVQGHGQVGYKRPEAVHQPALQYDIGLGLSYTGTGSASGISITTMAFATQDSLQRKVGGRGSLDYRIAGGRAPEAPSVSLSLGGKGNRVDTFQPGGTQTQSEVVIDLGIVGRF